MGAGLKQKFDDGTITRKDIWITSKVKLSFFLNKFLTLLMLIIYHITFYRFGTLSTVMIGLKCACVKPSRTWDWTIWTCASFIGHMVFRCDLNPIIVAEELYWHWFIIYILGGRRCVSEGRWWQYSNLRCGLDGNLESTRRMPKERSNSINRFVKLQQSAD